MTANVFPAIVPTTTDGLVDWNAVTALPAAQREAVITALTGINPETTADRHDVTVVVDMHDPAMSALVSERAYAAPADASLLHAPTLRSVLADAAHDVPTVDHALVLTALMHADVWTAARTRESSPRVKMATLAREVTGSDDKTAVRRVRAVLDDVIDHLSDAIADTAERADAPARRTVLPVVDRGIRRTTRTTTNTYAVPVVTTRTRVPFVPDTFYETVTRTITATDHETVVSSLPRVVAARMHSTGGRGDASALLSVSDRTTRRERAAAREVAREVAPERFPGRTAPTAPEESPVDVRPLPDAVAAAWLTEATARAMADRFRAMRAIVDRDAGRERAARAATGNGTRAAKPTTRAKRPATAARVSVVNAPSGRERLAALRRRR
jgi:hypothetical protein